MSLRIDAKEGYFGTVHPQGRTYAVSLTAARGATSYLDFAAGEYDCWIPAAVAGDLLLIQYLPNPAVQDKPDTTKTIAPWAAPTPGANSQADGTPTGATGGGWVPADHSPIQIPILPGYRCAVVFTGGGAQLNATKVL